MMAINNMTVHVHVNTSELDEALRKVDELLQKHDRTMPEVATLAAGVGSVLLGTPKPVTRRNLLSFGLLKS